MQIRRNCRSSFAWDIEIEDALQECELIEPANKQDATRLLQDAVGRITTFKDTSIEAIPPLSSLRKREGDCRSATMLAALLATRYEIGAFITLYPANDLGDTGSSHIFLEIIKENSLDVSKAVTTRIDLPSGWRDFPEIPAHKIIRYPLERLLEAPETDIVFELSRLRSTLLKRQ